MSQAATRATISSLAVSSSSTTASSPGDRSNWAVARTGRAGQRKSDPRARSDTEAPRRDPHHPAETRPRRSQSTGVRRATHQDFQRGTRGPLGATMLRPDPQRTDRPGRSLRGSSPNTRSPSCWITCPTILWLAAVIVGERTRLAWLLREGPRSGADRRPSHPCGRRKHEAQGRGVDDLVQRELGKPGPATDGCSGGIAGGAQRDELAGTILSWAVSASDLLPRGVQAHATWALVPVVSSSSPGSSSSLARRCRPGTCGRPR